MSYGPNSLGGGCPFQAKEDMGGFVSYAEKIDTRKIRERSPSFFDHFSQAALFFNSQSDPEKAHIVKALQFELGKVEVEAIRVRMVGMLAYVDRTLAAQVAKGLGLKVPAKLDAPLNMSVPADGNPKDFQPKRGPASVQSSAALSMANTIKQGIKTRKVAFLAADGFDDTGFSIMKQALTAAGAQVKVVAPRLGFLTSTTGTELKIDFSLLTTASVLFDAVFVPGGNRSVEALKAETAAIHFVNEAYKHCKTIAATGAGAGLLRASYLDESLMDEGVIISPGDHPGKVAAKFIKAIAQHRHWSREIKDSVPA